MSVRDAAGRHSRLTRGDLATDAPPARSRRQVHARRVVRRADRRPPGPLLVCLVAIALAVAEAVTSAAGSRSSGVAAGTPSGVATAIGPSRVVGGGPELVDPRPPGDAPRRTVQAISGGSASELAAQAATEPGDPLPACGHADLPAPRSGFDDWGTTIVDTAFVLPAGYRPPDLVPVGRADIGGWGLVRALVVDDLAALADGAARAGNPLAVQSAYRSEVRQSEVYGGWVASSGEAAARRFSARPGHSEHQLGTSLDLRAAAGNAPWSGAFAATAAGHWLAKHAPEYGFVLSYAKGQEDVTCYGAEPWHVRYVGRTRAAEVAASGLPLRVWLWRYGEDR